jgi:septal ring factor EnvC (AmiA/AmiB activator)
MTSPSVDLKALRELLEKATRRLSTDLPRAEYEEIKECGNELDAMSPNLARTVLDQADRLEAITRELAEMRRNCDSETDARAIVESNLQDMETALAEARQKLAEIGEIAARMTKQANDADRSGGAFADIANLAKDKTHGDMD